MPQWAMKRFWHETLVRPVDGQYPGFQVLLDTRSVKTPAKSTLVAPSMAMAHAIAAEWETQADQIDPLSMPITRSLNAAIDKVRPQSTEVAQLVASYGASDLLCYRADAPHKLVERQNQSWNPLLDWAAKELKARLRVVKGVMHTEQPAHSTSALQQLVVAQNEFELTALHDLVTLTGSLVIGLAAQRQAFTIDDLWAASWIDEAWQAEQWGNDEEATKVAALKRKAFIHAEHFYKLSQLP